MESDRQAIFKNSDKAISKLQLLAVFFEHELIFRIYVRTQVIHKFFESNPELDIHKLDLFHIQFTDSIIELLKKIKRNNEKAVVATQTEIALNEELITSISNTMDVERDYNKSIEAHVVAVNQSLYKLYQNLSDLSADIPFPKAFDAFSLKFSKDFFLEADAGLVDELINYESVPVYKNGYGIVEKKLMGLQCVHSFKNEFYCGLKAGNKCIEVYRIAENAEAYFLFYPAKHLFLCVDFLRIKEINLSEGKQRRSG